MAELYVMLPKYQSGHDFSKVGYTEDDVRRLYMRLWLRHAHEGDPAPDIKWSAEDDAALRACAGVLDGEK